MGAGRPTNAERERIRLLKEQGLLPEKVKKGVGRPKKSSVENNTIQPSKAGDISIKDLEKEIQEDTRSVNPANDFNHSDDDVIVDDDFNNNENVEVNDDVTEKKYTEYEEITVPENDDLSSATNSSEPELKDVNDEVHDVDYDPLNQPVKERDYTNLGSNKQQAGTNNGTTTGTTGNGSTFTPPPPINEEFIPEPKIDYNNDSDFVNDKKDKDKTTGGGKDGGSNINKEPKREPLNPKLDDLSPAQKRKSAEKLADVILVNYQQIFPMPFKWTAKFNLTKLDRMHRAGDIDLNMSDEDGTTVRQFCEQRNQTVNEAFVITEAQKNEIKEPLVDVLMENNVALTPTQRLLVAVGGHVLSLGVAAGQMAVENSKYVKQFVEESAKNRLNKEEIIREYEEKKNKENNKNNQAQQKTQQAKTTPAPTPKPTPKKEADDDVKFTPPKSDFEDDVDGVTEPTDKTPKKPTSTQAEVKPEPKKEESDGKLEEYLTAENGGITVEEYMTEEPNDDV